MEADPAEAIFGTETPDLFGALNVPRDAPTATITSSYRKLALRYHPDKVPLTATEEDKAAARKKFEQIGYAYKVLSDEKRRKRFEETGKTDEHFLEGGDEATWTEYFKDLWSGVVSADTIAEFEKKYKGSDEELQDLYAAYLSTEGSLQGIFESVMLSDVLADEARFVSLVDAGISEGKLPSLPQWTKDKKDKKGRERLRKEARKEASEAEEYAKELGVHDELFGNGASTSKGKKGKGKKGAAAEDDPDAALRALIQRKNANSAGTFETMIAGLEARAMAEDAKEKAKRNGKGKGGKGKKRAAAVDEEDEEDEVEASPKGGKRKKDEPPTEEEFQKLQAEMAKRKQAEKNGAPSTNGKAAKKASKSK